MMGSHVSVELPARGPSIMYSFSLDGGNIDGLSSLLGFKHLPFFKNTVLREFDSIEFINTKKKKKKR